MCYFGEDLNIYMIWKQLKNVYWLTFFIFIQNLFFTKYERVSTWFMIFLFFIIYKNARKCKMCTIFSYNDKKIFICYIYMDFMLNKKFKKLLLKRMKFIIGVPLHMTLFW